MGQSPPFPGHQGSWDKTHTNVLHIYIGLEEHAERVGDVPAAQVGAASELVPGLGVSAPFGLGCCVGGVVAELKG